MDCSMPGFPVLHHLCELTQSHVHWAGDTIQPSHPLLFPSPPAFNLSQNQGLFQWVHSYWNFLLHGACVCMYVHHSVMSNLLQTIDCSLPGFFLHWNFPGKNTGVGCHLLLQEIFPIQGLNPCLQCLLHWQMDSLSLEQPGEPYAAYKL